MDWVRGEAVGHGSFGKVNIVIPKKQSTQFLPSMVVKSSGVSHSASLVNEKKILDELNGCPEIVRCFGESCSFENGESLYNLLLEYVSGGSLAEKVKKSENHKLPEFEVSGYTKGILRGLQYVHETGYVHCDIKLQNILLGEDGKVKIADFGLAKRVGAKKDDDDLRCELRGTPLYMSPEMVIGGGQGTPADIWALGCVVAEMVAGVTAYRFSDVTELLMAIGVKNQLPQIPEELSEEGKDFLSKCFVKDPRERWTAEMLLKHPFVADHDTATFNEEEIKSGVPSISPKCPFDFPDWVSDDNAQSLATCSITFLPSPENQENLNLSSGYWSTSPAERLRGLVTEFKLECEWCSDDDWITVR